MYEQNLFSDISAGKLKDTLKLKVSESVNCNNNRLGGASHQRRSHILT
jgi:hypothetical protein